MRAKAGAFGRDWGFGTIQRLQSIQALRGIAALSVFTYHLIATADRYTSANLKHFVSVLPIGVDLFFVISGFVMAYSVRNFAGVGGASIFLARRIWRIAPLLYVVSTAYVLMAWAYGYALDAARIANCFTILPLSASPAHYQYALVPAWTLGFEMAFYLLVAAVLASGTRHRFPVLIGAVCLLPFVAMGSLMIEFGFGVAAYWIWSKDLLRPRHAAPLLTVAVVLFILAWGRAEVIAWGIPCALAFAAALSWQKPPEALLRLGNISYSLYLSHVLTFDALVPLLLPVGLWVMVAVMAPVGIVIAWLVYEAIEAPLQRMWSHSRGDERAAMAHASRA